jgi:hypothetical protein
VNEQELPRKVAQRLEEGLETISPAISRRLATAREAALARVHGGEALVGRSAGALLAGAPGRFLDRRILAPALALVLALLGVLYWQQAQRVHQYHADAREYADARYADIDALDADVLGEELPVTAYLDQGFEVWLYHHSPASERRP